MKYIEFENDYKHILMIASSIILLQSQLCSNIELDIYALCVDAKSGFCIFLIMSESLSELQMLFSGMINHCIEWISITVQFYIIKMVSRRMTIIQDIIVIVELIACIFEILQAVLYL